MGPEAREQLWKCWGDPDVDTERVAIKSVFFVFKILTLFYLFDLVI